MQKEKTYKNETMLLLSDSSIPSLGFSADSLSIQEMTSVHRGMFDEPQPAYDFSMDEAAFSPGQTTNKNNEKTLAAKVNRQRKRIRRPIPDKKEFIPETAPMEMDVISGRGGRSNVHPGNRAYWIQVLCERPGYLACHPTDEAKNHIAQKVYNYVTKNQLGRFVQLDPGTKRWFVLPEKVALIKIKQALRDRHVPKWAENLLTAETRSLLLTSGFSPQKQNNQPLAGMERVIEETRFREWGKPEPIYSSRVTPDADYITTEGMANCYSNLATTNNQKSDERLDLEIFGFGDTSWTKSIDLVRDVIEEFAAADDDSPLQKVPDDDDGLWDDLFLDTHDF